MGKHIFFVGGGDCIETGKFYDPPMHRDCAIFALRTCPFLSRSKGRASATAPEHIGVVKAHMAKVVKTEKFALMHTSGYEFHVEQGGMIAIKAKLPWFRVEAWRDGQPQDHPAPTSELVTVRP